MLHDLGRDRDPARPAARSSRPARRRPAARVGRPRRDRRALRPRSCWQRARRAARRRSRRAARRRAGGSTPGSGRVELEAGYGWPLGEDTVGAASTAPMSPGCCPSPRSPSPASAPGSTARRSSAPGSAAASSRRSPAMGAAAPRSAVYSRDERRFSPQEIEAVAAVAELIAAARARVRISRLEGALDVARRQASVGALLSGVAHDFNNMLSVMLGYARLMEEEARDSELLSEGVAEIEAAARRAMRLSRSLVDLGRPTSTEPEVLEVGADRRRGRRALAPDARRPDHARGRDRRARAPRADAARRARPGDRQPRWPTPRRAPRRRPRPDPGRARRRPSGATGRAMGQTAGRRPAATS